MKHLTVLLLCWTVMGTAYNTVDGDTFDVRISIWQQIEVKERIRLLGFDTPEMSGSDRPRAIAAKAFTEAWLAKGPFNIISCSRDSFGRVLAQVFREPTAPWGDGKTRDVLAVRLDEAGHRK